jgi:hypothetical protein
MSNLKDCKQELNKILMKYIDVDKHTDYTNYKELINAIIEWSENKNEI